MTTLMAEQHFYIVSVCHTQRTHKFITFWRPKNSGYAWPLSWAGKYPESAVASSLGYYNDGGNNIAVRCEVADAIAVQPIKGQIDGDAGPVVLNNAANWRALIDAVIAAPHYKPKPEYRGAPRVKAA